MVRAYRRIVEGSGMVSEYVSEDVARSLDRYVRFGIAPGGFLTAVLENKLFESMERADSESRAQLFGLVCYISNHLPNGCWGSARKVEEWIETTRLEQRLEREEKYRERDIPEPVLTIPSEFGYSEHSADSCRYTAQEDVPGFGGDND